MNIYTFKDVTTSKRQSLAHDIDDGPDDEDDEGVTRQITEAVEGEEGEDSYQVGDLHLTKNDTYTTILIMLYSFCGSLMRPEKLLSLLI